MSQPEWVFLRDGMELLHNLPFCSERHSQGNTVTSGAKNQFAIRKNLGFFCCRFYCSKSIPEDIVTQWKLLNT